VIDCRRRLCSPALSGTAFGVLASYGGRYRGWSLRSTPGYPLGPRPGSVVPGSHSWCASRTTGGHPLFMNPHQMPHHVLLPRLTMPLENWPMSLPLTTRPVTTATLRPLIAEGLRPRYPTRGSRAERGLWS
jgi:hypothetical protein